MGQSGFPFKAWELVVGYAATALTLTQRAPILPWEKDDSGKVLEKYRAKESQTCWECHHDGSKFDGPIQPFGRLCFYLN